MISFESIFYIIMMITLLIALAEVALRAHNTLEIYSLEEEAEIVEIEDNKNSFQYTLKEEEKEYFFDELADSEWYYDLINHNTNSGKTNYKIKVYDKNRLYELDILIESKRVLLYNIDLTDSKNNKYYISYNDNLTRYAEHLKENYSK